jgi:hypothetical protein
MVLIGAVPTLPDPTVMNLIDEGLDASKGDDG